MQSAIKSADPTRPAKKTVFNTLSYIYRTNGIRGLYRGVTPRIGLGKSGHASLPFHQADRLIRCMADNLHGQLCRLR
jgi:hypothetical protein